MKNQHLFRRSWGLSLIELMIAMVLGGLIMLTVSSVYLSSIQSFRTQEGMARMQEGARFVFETIGFDLRQTGFGCLSVAPGTVDETTGGWYKNLFRCPLRGYKDGAGSPYASDDVDNTDALWILRADQTLERRVTTPGTTDAAHGISSNGWIVITDHYTNASLYQATAASGTTYTLGTATNCTGTSVVDSANSRFLPLAAHFYYIRLNPANEPSLYRQTLLSNGTLEAQEFVEGVEDMEILYGEDTTTVCTVTGCTPASCKDISCQANIYVDADTVTDWSRVVAVRITLTMRTADNLSANTGGTDRRIRRTFTTTIAVRNRL